MRVSREERDRSHARIIASAARLIRERGLGASVADVMSAAGLTHGGFYNHFDSKDALLAASIGAAFDEVASELSRRIKALGPEKGVAAFRASYLSDRHLDRLEISCPAAVLGTEVGRAPEPLKTRFGAGIRRLIEALSADGKGSAQQRRAMAARDLATMVGAVVIARASDPETAREMLRACRES
jgi:TetR/AcrR family transcriptional regulator, transcriptional repressor for nem operon